MITERATCPGGTLPDFRRRRTGWVVPFAVAAICAALAVFGIALTADTGHVAPIWPMNAFVVALMIRQDRGTWPWLAAAAALGGLVGNLYMDRSWPTAAALSGTNVFEILACAVMFRHLAGERSGIAEPRPLLLFLGVAVTVPALSALMAAIVLTILHVAPFYEVFRYWYAADVLGLLVFAPALLAVDWRKLGRLHRPSLRAASLMILPALCLLVLAVFTQSSYPFLFMLAPALIFIAFRLGTRWNGARASTHRGHRHRADRIRARPDAADLRHGDGADSSSASVSRAHLPIHAAYRRSRNTERAKSGLG